MRTDRRKYNFALFAAASAMAVIPLLTVPLLSQNSSSSIKPTFEVASVKPSAPGTRGGGFSERGDRIDLSGYTLRRLLEYAYRKNTPFLKNQMIGGPNWIDVDQFDVQAKVDCRDGSITRQQEQRMFQSLLEDRFQLKAHLETRELPIYEAIVGKDGPKIKPSENQAPTFTPVSPETSTALCKPPRDLTTAPLFDPKAPMPRGSYRISGGTNRRSMEFTAVPLWVLFNNIQSDVGRLITDKTELKGVFDFKLEFSPDVLTTPSGALTQPAEAAAALDPLPSLMTALQRQLGLRLESAKGPVDVLVIESVQKPDEN